MSLASDVGKSKTHQAACVPKAKKHQQAERKRRKGNQMTFGGYDRVAGQWQIMHCRINATMRWLEGDLIRTMQPLDFGHLTLEANKQHGGRECVGLDWGAGTFASVI